VIDDSFTIKYPCHVIWRILKEDMSFSDLRVLHAILGRFNTAELYEYDMNILDYVVRREKKQEITTTRYDRKALKDLITTNEFRRKGLLAKSMTHLQLKGFIKFNTLIAAGGCKYYQLLDKRNPYRRVPYKVIDEYDTKNVLVIKIVLWLYVIQTARIKDRDGNFNIRISLNEFINDYLHCYKNIPTREVNRKIKNAVSIITSKNKNVKAFLDEVNYFNFSWNFSV
jgi:hypothetical protein